jgi:hypothetical protein
MKNTILTTLLLFFANFCIGQVSVNPKKQTQDPSLVGSWNGSEKNMQKMGLVKYWIQNRFEDGTFVSIATTIEDDVVKNYSEKGKWWVEDGKLYEQYFSSKTTNVYVYELVDENHVKFEGIKKGPDFDKKDYETIESKLEDVR